MWLLFLMGVKIKLEIEMFERVRERIWRTCWLLEKVVDRKGIRESWVWKIGCCVVGPWFSGIVSVSTAYKRVQSPTQLIALLLLLLFLFNLCFDGKYFPEKNIFQWKLFVKKSSYFVGFSYRLKNKLDT